MTKYPQHMCGLSDNAEIQYKKSISRPLAIVLLCYCLQALHLAARHLVFQKIIKNYILTLSLRDCYNTSTYQGNGINFFQSIYSA